MNHRRCPRPTGTRSAPTDQPFWHDELTPVGFVVGAGAFSCAVHAGGEHNGVRTAVEDTMTWAADALSFQVIPAVFGMGVPVGRDSHATGAWLDSIQRYSSSVLLRIMENNRIALYTRVLQLQFEAAAAAASTDRLAEKVAEQQHTIDRLEMERATAEARHAADLDVRDQQIRVLREQLEQVRQMRGGSILRRG